MHENSFDVFKILLQNVIYLASPELFFPKALPFLQLEVGYDLFED